MAKIGRTAREGIAELLEESPEFRAEYERLGPRYAAITALLNARRKRKLTQTQLAERMGVTQGVVSRLESGEHSPKLETLQAAADAMNYRLEVRFVANRGRAVAV